MKRVRGHDRRIRETPIEPPKMTTRPEGMTRQVQRRLYREACKRMGVPWKKS